MATTDISRSLVRLRLRGLFCCRHREAKQKCSMRGSNPRPLAHKTNTLPTELMEHVCGSWLPASLTVVEFPANTFFFYTFLSLPWLAWLALGKGRNRLILHPATLKLETILPLFSAVLVQEELPPAYSLYHTAAKKKRSAQPESNQ
jgi:hypothetical protein